MASLDEMLVQAEVQEASADSWELLDQYESKEFYIDDEEYIQVLGRSIGDVSKNISISGEENSQYIEFRMSRYYDGIDLSKMVLSIFYEAEDQSGESLLVNVYKSTNEIKFGWVIDSAITQFKEISFSVCARGNLEDGSDYWLKTFPKVYTINTGITPGESIKEPDRSWYLNFVRTMDVKVSTASAYANAAKASAAEVKASEEIVRTMSDDVNTKSSQVNVQYSEIKTMTAESKEAAASAKADADRAEIAAENAEAISNIEIMTTEKTGIGKPDGKTITADEDGTMRVTSHSDVALNRQTLGYTKKNIMLPKFVSLNKTVSGVTFTDNGDGSIHVKGTSTALINFAIVGNTAKKIDFVSAGTKLTFSNTSDKCGVMFAPTSSGTTLSTSFTVFNGEKSMTLNNDSDTTDWYIAIFMYSGVTIDETIYPMIRSADITDDTFEPYVDDVNTRLENVETEVVPIERGGTGGTTAKEAQYNLLKDMNEVAETISDETRIMFQYGSPSQSLGGAYYRKAIHLWNYIKSKLGDICKRTVKSANATTHSNYPTDNDKIPDMSFMSYWNGAYGDGGASNLTYCKFGAFGTMATKYATDYTPVANLVTTVAGKPLDATMGKTLNDKITAVETKQGGCYLKYENGKFYIGYDDTVMGV